MVSSSSSGNGGKNSGQDNGRDASGQKSAQPSDNFGSAQILDEAIPHFDYFKLKGTEPWLLADNFLWKQYARAIIDRIRETQSFELFSNSAKIQHDFNHPVKRQDLESRLCGEKTCGKDFRNLDFVGNMVDMSTKWKYIYDPKDLSNEDTYYLYKKYKLKYS
jgi:hypothetical protein